MKYQFMKDNSMTFPVKKMAKILNVSRSSYYDWLRREPTEKDVLNNLFILKIKKIFKDNDNRYGSPRIYKEMKKTGFFCSLNKTAKIMRRNGLIARPKRRFKVTTDSSHHYPISPNLLSRNFKVAFMNSVWVSDITYIRTDQGWLYLCIVLDLYSRRVVGYSMASHLRAELAIDALEMAVRYRKPGSGLIFHSDRGIQYASEDFRKKLSSYKMIQSMSRKGDCWDNACAESFFSTLKLEEVYRKKYRTKEEARESIFEYIAVYYNRRRSHSFLDFLSPEEYKGRVIKKVSLNLVSGKLGQAQLAPAKTGRT